MTDIIILYCYIYKANIRIYKRNNSNFVVILSPHIKYFFMIQLHKRNGTEAVLGLPVLRLLLLNRRLLISQYS